MKLKLIIVNLLTLIRIIGVFLLIPVYHYYGTFYVGVLSLICYLTDSLDGILARKFKASTFFGALFDGTADKLFTIMNFIVLYLITPYAIIPIIIELLIVITLFYKYKNNLNLKSNIIGKSKVWVLAICVVLIFLINNKYNIYLLIPAIIMELLTLISYILEIIIPKNVKQFKIERKEIDFKLDGKNKWDNFKKIWLNPHFYEEHKNDSNLRKLTKLS